jgi:aquaporin Z
MNIAKKCAAEALGTFWLTFGGCGSAILAAKFLDTTENAPLNMGIAHLGVALAFGLTVLTMAYSIGHISGCHLNPAVSFGLMVAKRFPASEFVPYVIAQVAGAALGAGLLYVIASSQTEFVLGSFACNGYGKHSPSGYSLLECFITEFILTFFFLWIILGSTDTRAPAGFAPLAIGLALTLIHLIGIPVTNLSVNPARSTGPALIVQSWAVNQLWLFWVAPLLGAAVAGLAYNVISKEDA